VGVFPYFIFLGVYFGLVLGEVFFFFLSCTPVRYVGNFFSSPSPVRLAASGFFSFSPPCVSSEASGRFSFFLLFSAEYRPGSWPLSSLWWLWSPTLFFFRRALRVGDDHADPPFYICGEIVKRRTSLNHLFANLKTTAGHTPSPSETAA